MLWQRFNGKRFNLLAAAALCGLVVLTIALTYFYAERSGVERLRLEGEKRLDLYIKSLEGELVRYDYLPTVLALNNDVVTMLRHPNDAALVQKVNDYLTRVNERARSSAIYIMDLDGLTLAASNWNEEVSFVGVNLAYRPYFQEALRGDNARFYGIGTTSGVPGYFRAYPIVSDTTIGVMALKVSLENLEDVWRKGSEIAALADNKGVIFMTSLPAWKYKTLGPLNPAALEQIRASRQYEGAALHAVSGKIDKLLGSELRVITLGLEGPEASDKHQRYLEQSRSLGVIGWKLIFLSDLSPVESSARSTAIIGGCAAGLLLLLLLYLHEHRRALTAEVAARTALQRAHDGLEQDVADRTAALTAANTELQKEIADKTRAQSVLREAQDGLVQAEKMAVLGQLSAGITHELNQPLTALRTLSDNAVVLLDRDRIPGVRANLLMISDLTERLGQIVAQFKSFARKSTLPSGIIPIHRIVTDALFIIEQELRAKQISLDQDIPTQEYYVRGDAVRLEQVLVNLFSNAVHAMDRSSSKRLTLRVSREGDRLLIRVADTGHGISDEVLPRLCEPFFTTKRPGVGLGLGLAISADILREAGGTLSARNLPQGGAEFTVSLPHVDQEPRDA